MDWFLYDNGLRHERVKLDFQNLKPLKIILLLPGILPFNKCINSFMTEAVYDNGLRHERVKEQISHFVKNLSLINFHE